MHFQSAFALLALLPLLLAAPSVFERTPPQAECPAPPPAVTITSVTVSTTTCVETKTLPAETKIVPTTVVTTTTFTASATPVTATATVSQICRQVCDATTIYPPPPATTTLHKEGALPEETATW